MIWLLFPSYYQVLFYSKDCSWFMSYKRFDFLNLFILFQVTSYKCIVFNIDNCPSLRNQNFGTWICYKILLNPIQDSIGNLHKNCLYFWTHIISRTACSNSTWNLDWFNIYFVNLYSSCLFFFPPSNISNISIFY